MREYHMKVMQRFLFCFGLIAGLTATEPLWAAVSFNLDYSTSTVLPSAAGFTYTPGTPAYPEVPSYSVSSQLLHLNTIQFSSSDKMAYYELSNAYDHTVDTELTMSVRVTQLDKFYGLQVEFADSTRSAYYVVTPTGWTLPFTGQSGVFANPSAFHVITLRSFAATQTFDFLIDNVSVASGSLGAGVPGTSFVNFGDVSPTGGNMIAEFEYIRYNYTPPPSSTVPEPAAALLWTLGGLSVCGASIVRRRRRANA